MKSNWVVTEKGFVSDNSRRMQSVIISDMIN